jgi:hypothetical protein
VSDYDELDVPVPRPEALCRSFVRRLDPIWGYVFAACLLAVGGGVLGVLALITVTPMLGIAAKTLAAKISAIIALALGYLLAYVIFTRWRRARMGSKLALIRDGQLTKAMVEKRSMAVDKGRTDITFALPDGTIMTCAFNFWFAPEAEAAVRVLWSGSSHMLAFDRAGRMYSGHIKNISITRSKAMRPRGKAARGS